eukprot:SAG31_NODE_12982_length_901_cov_2.544888_1_plen_50_part_10
MFGDHAESIVHAVMHGNGEAWRPNQGNVAWVHGTTSLPAGKRALRFNGVS